MWTKAQSAAFAKALAVCAEWDEKIARLEQIAKHSPAIAEQVAELRVMCDQIRQTAEAAIAVEATAPKQTSAKGK